jgi:hypothetical protein
LDSALHNTKQKHRKMTTDKAVLAGKAVEGKTSQTAKETEAQTQAFKGVSAFHIFFGLAWNIIGRIAFDCAHEFGNLGMDLLALINNKDKMHFNESRQAAHKKIKRGHGDLTGYANDTHHIYKCEYNRHTLYLHM